MRDRNTRGSRPRSGEKSSSRKPAGKFQRSDRSAGGEKKWSKDKPAFGGDRKFNRERPTVGGDRKFDRNRPARPGGFKKRGEGESSQGGEKKWNRRESHEFFGEKKKRFSREGDRKKAFGSERSGQPSKGSDRFSDRKEGFKKSSEGFSKRSVGFSKRGERFVRSTDGFKKQSEGFPKRSDKFSKGNRKFGKPFKKKEEFPTEGDGLVRLNKFIANAGIASRREADELIEAGVISVNGEIVTTLGYKVKPTDVVKYSDETLRSEKPVYILLNKPKDYITTVEDTHDRRTVMSLVSDIKERVYPVGRLDRNTTGLLLITNDGDLAKRLMHPSFEAQKVYEVQLDKNVRHEDLDQIREGIALEDGFIKPDDVSYSPTSKAIVGIELHSGKNRIVRRIFEHFGYTVRKLDRVLYAGLTKKNLPRGRWRFLTPMEVANLKMATGRVKG